MGDLTGNSLCYSLVGLGEDGKQTWLRGGVLGLVAGLGAVTLPSVFGLATAPSRRIPGDGPDDRLLYLEGGIAAAAAYRLWRKAE